MKLRLTLLALALSASAMAQTLHLTPGGCGISNLNCNFVGLAEGGHVWINIATSPYRANFIQFSEAHSHITGTAHTPNYMKETVVALPEEHNSYKLLVNSFSFIDTDEKAHTGTAEIYYSYVYVGGRYGGWHAAINRGTITLR